MPGCQDDIATAATRAISIAMRHGIIDTTIGGDMPIITWPTYLTDPKMIGIPLEFISEGHSRNVDLATLEDKI